jgi:hypothetical protein
MYVQLLCAELTSVEPGLSSRRRNEPCTRLIHSSEPSFRCPQRILATAYTILSFTSGSFPGGGGERICSALGFRPVHLFSPALQQYICHCTVRQRRVSDLACLGSRKVHSAVRSSPIIDPDDTDMSPTFTNTVSSCVVPRTITCTKHRATVSASESSWSVGDALDRAQAVLVSAHLAAEAERSL